jgi:hypothetical protein
MYLFVWPFRDRSFYRLKIDLFVPFLNYLAIYFLSYLARTVSRAALLHRSNAEKNSPVAIIGLIDLSGTINELECT